MFTIIWLIRSYFLVFNTVFSNVFFEVGVAVGDPHGFLLAGEDLFRSCF